MDTEKPRCKSDMVCPFHRAPMSEVCHNCPLWCCVRGKHPQSEEVIDRWECSLALMPLLMVENSQMQRQTGAAVESFRNEMVRLNEQAKPCSHMWEAITDTTGTYARCVLCGATGDRVKQLARG